MSLMIITGEGSGDSANAHTSSGNGCHRLSKLSVGRIQHSIGFRRDEITYHPVSQPLDGYARFTSTTFTSNYYAEGAFQDIRNTR